MPKVTKEVYSDNRDMMLSDNYDVVKFVSEVHANIKNRIPNDIILAKYDDKDREFSVEMLYNSYFNASICMGLLSACKTDEEKKKLRKISTEIFDILAMNPKLLAIHNRNRPENWHMRLITGFSDKYEEEMQLKNERKLLGLLKNQSNENKGGGLG